MTDIHALVRLLQDFPTSPLCLSIKLIRLDLYTHREVLRIQQAFTRFNFSFFFFRCRDLLIKVEELRGVLRRLDFGGQMVEAKQGLWFNLRENEI